MTQSSVYEASAPSVHITRADYRRNTDIGKSGFSKTFVQTSGSQNIWLRHISNEYKYRNMKYSVGGLWHLKSV
jgi:hypothetical protein